MRVMRQRRLRPISESVAQNDTGLPSHVARKQRANRLNRPLK